jgi:catechol 2,3-dioxygenase-like lactoylglutathione lyase family enzyme
MKPFDRSVFLLGLALTLCGCARVADQPDAGPPPAKARVDAVVSVGMTVCDMDRATDFYSKVLSFEKVSDVEVAGTEYERLTGVFGLRIRVVRMKLGEESLDLTEFLAPRGRPVPLDTRSNDRWFQHVAIIVRDMDKAYQHLRKHKVEHASTGPQRLPDWNKKASGIKAFYFKDPDGHHLEILQFPPDKGDARWHKKTDRLFLGIDHTAIVVADTEASLLFYRDRLGLKVVGESENHGTEQEHLNNVFGARLRITTLRAAKGPAVEFLEYLTPRDGRPAPTDSRANDLWHWQARLRATQVSQVAEVVRGSAGRLISPNVVAVSDDQLDYTKGLLARDPDGHALFFTDK